MRTPPTPPLCLRGYHKTSAGGAHDLGSGLVPGQEAVVEAVVQVRH